MLRATVSPVGPGWVGRLLGIALSTVLIGFLGDQCLGQAEKSSDNKDPHGQERRDHTSQQHDSDDAHPEL